MALVNLILKFTTAGCYNSGTILSAIHQCFVCVTTPAVLSQATFSYSGARQLDTLIFTIGLNELLYGGENVTSVECFGARFGELRVSSLKPAKRNSKNAKIDFSWLSSVSN